MVKNKEEDLWKTTHKEEDNGLKQQAAVHGMYWWHSRCTGQQRHQSYIEKKGSSYCLPACEERRLAALCYSNNIEDK